MENAVNIIGQIAVILASVIHVMFFVMESMLFARRPVQEAFRVAPDDLKAVRPWAFNLGFYNLFLAIGAFAGAVALHSGSPEAGRALIALSCGSMLAAAVVLLATNRRMLRAASLQGLAPLLALIFLLA
jgi:putative membrane protein